MNRLAKLILASLLSILTAMAQAQAQPIITTVAGGGPNNIPALDANLNFPTGVAVDSAGNQYIVAQYQNRIFKVDTTGQLTVVAGNGLVGFSGDGGLATAATLYNPDGVTFDSGGNLYIADTFNQRIRRVDAVTGIITTVAGSSASSDGDGGSATTAKLYYPQGVAVDSGGNLYIADTYNNRIRRVDAATGIISTVAGNGTFGFSGDDALATAATLAWPSGVALDGGGNLYIVDFNNLRIRRVDAATGVITTVAGNGILGFGGDGGLATSASLYSPHKVAVDNGGNLYIADTGNKRIRRVDAATRVITTVAGNGSINFSGDGGLATAASLFFPWGVAVDGGGNIYIADTSNYRIRRVAQNGIITTVAGNGTIGFSGDGGPATSASLYFPFGVAAGGRGNLYIADYFNHRIRCIETGGIITTVAGNGTQGSSGDGGLATAASLVSPVGVALDANGNVYISDYNSQRVRQVDHSTGVITTVAGNGNLGFSGDGGLATAASLAGPIGLAIDRSGNLYISDAPNNRIRRVDHRSGVITTVVGNGTQGFSGDGGPATSASLYYPFGVTVDRSGNLYISDYNNYRIRRVDTNGDITTVAGNGTFGFSGDGGSAISASLRWPSGVALDSSGNLYIADLANQRIRRVGTSGVITTVAGNGLSYFSGDGGLATSASLQVPVGVALDASGNLYIADQANNRIRKVGLTLASDINSLAGEIANSSLPPAIKTSMMGRLNTAKDKVSDSNPNNDAAACGILGSIVNEITDMQNSGRLGAVEADALRQSANAARLAIGCQ